MQNFRALGAEPPDPRAYGGWRLCPKTPIGLRRLGGLPPDPQISPPLRISGYAPGVSNDQLPCAKDRNVIEQFFEEQIISKPSQKILKYFKVFLLLNNINFHCISK